VFIT